MSKPSKTLDYTPSAKEWDEKTLKHTIKECNHSQNKCDTHIQNFENFFELLEFENSTISGALADFKALSRHRQARIDIKKIKKQTAGLENQLSQKRLNFGSYVMESLDLDIQLRDEHSNLDSLQKEIKSLEKQLNWLGKG